MKTMKTGEKKRHTAVFSFLWILLCLGLCGCAEKNGQQMTESAQQEQPLRIGSLKGPTSMGILFLKEQAKLGETEGSYEFQMAAKADEILPLMVKGELDIALIPSNTAGILYQKTKGGIAVADINTLGVLYMVSGDEGIQSVEDLKNKKIYLTGKGTTPDYVLHYILEENGLTEADYQLEYRSEPTEVAALLAENQEAVGLLPQPFVTAVCMQNEKLDVVLDLNQEWDRLQGEKGSRLVTGVTVVRREILETRADEILTFLAEHEASVARMNEETQAGAALVTEAGIVGKEQIAALAIPKCNLTFLQGEEMKLALQGYLEVLYDRAPDSVGGSLPDEDFYYVP